ncbi:MAG: phosphotransferase family protein [Chloroflexota bacterium]
MADELTPPISTAELANVVQTYLGNERVRVTDWRWQPVDFIPVNPSTGGLYRVSGEARSPYASPIPWSLVMKVIQASRSSPDVPDHWNYWKREALAYQSGLPYRLPAGVTAPRLAGVVPDPANPLRLYLFLEDIQDEPAAGWSLADNRALAEGLGCWAALPHHEPLSLPWLSQAYLRGMLQTGATITRQLDEQGVWEVPHIAREFSPSTVERIRSLPSERDQLLRVLDRLPRVLCHFDAHGGNIMRRRKEDGSTELVLIDWSSLGLGAMGEEIGQQFCTNVLSGVVPAAQANDVAEELIAAYTRGLRAAGVRADERAVRFGFVTAAALGGLGFSLPFFVRAGADPRDPAAVAVAAQLGAAARALLFYLEAAWQMARDGCGLLRHIG